MIYLLNYSIFNEGIFSSDNDNEIAMNICHNLMETINTLKNNIIKNNNGFIIKDIKLDEYLGTYTIYITENELKIEYHKYSVLQFTKILNCNESIRAEILDLINSNYSKEN